MRNCWREVAATLGFESRDIAKRCFDNLRKRFNKARNKINREGLNIKHQVNSLLCFYLPRKGPGIDQTALVQGVKVALTMYPPKVNFCANT